MAETENGPKVNETPPCLGPYALMTSLSIAEIALALSKAQGAMKPAEFDRENTGFKFRYATLASIWDAIRGPLSANQLAVTQIVSGMELVTMLMHSSGEFLRATMKLLPTQPTPQGFGSSLTYARRYCLSAIVGMAAADEDDDGNEASKPPAPKAQAQAARPVPKPTTPKPEPKPGVDLAEVFDVDKAAEPEPGRPADILTDFGVPVTAGDLKAEVEVILVLLHEAGITMEQCQAAMAKRPEFKGISDPWKLNPEQRRKLKKLIEDAKTVKAAAAAKARE